MFLSQLRFLTPADIIRAILDITLVAYLIYRLFLLVRGTRAVQLIRGLIILFVATFVSQWLQLYTINWLLQNIRMMLIVALPVVFQPELRRALEHLGRGKLFARPLAVLKEEDVKKMLDDLVRATEILSRNHTGAIMVLERETGLNDYIETGIKIDGLISSEFLVNIFVPNTPLHDGAVIIRGNRVQAAACFLPMTDAANLSVEFGSRHRAALGVSEVSDALVIVVSEETGTVSLANGGKLIRHLDSRTLREMLTALYLPKVAASLTLNRG